MYALPVAPSPSHRSKVHPRAHLPAVALWVASMIALLASVLLVPAVAGGSSSVLAGGVLAARAIPSPRVPQLRGPVDGPLVRGFEEPAGPFGPGHRGVDFAAVPGVPVRAPASGRVTFAGRVAGTTWVTIEVAPAVLVTLGPLRTLDSSVGQTTATGVRLGTLESGHAGADPSVAAVHLGLRVDGTYIDPLPWLAGLARPRLAPLSEPGGPH